MTSNDFASLNVGDIVRSKKDGRNFLVTGNYGDHVTAVCTMDMSNPPEWDIVVKAAYRLGNAVGNDQTDPS